MRYCPSGYLRLVRWSSEAPLTLNTLRCLPKPEPALAAAPRTMARNAAVSTAPEHEHVTSKNSKASAKYPAELVTAWAQCVDADLAHLRCQPCE